MIKKLLVIGIVVLVVAAGYWVVFGWKVTFEDISVSPDGMYKCKLAETSTPYQSKALIKVYKRKDLYGGNLWDLLKNQHVYNDSSCRSSYSIDWQYDKEKRTTGLIVFGDFGSLPFPGERIFEMTFSPSTDPKNPQ